MHETRWLHTGRLLAWSFLALGAAGLAGPAHAGDLVVYSARKIDQIRPTIERVEQAIGVTARVVQTTSVKGPARLRAERSNPQADIFINADTLGTVELARDGLLVPYVSPNAASVPGRFKDPKGLWTAATGRGRVMTYRRDLITDASVLPHGVHGLQGGPWAGTTYNGWRGTSVVGWVRPWGGTRGAYTAFLYERDGRKKVMELNRHLKAQGTKISGGNGGTRRRIARGEFLIGPNNDAGVYELIARKGAPLGVYYLDQDGQGTFVNPLPIAIIKDSPEARRFVDEFLSKENVQFLVDTAYELPLIPGIRLPKVIAETVGTEKSDDLFDHLKVSPIGPKELSTSHGQVARDMQEVWER